MKRLLLLTSIVLITFLNTGCATWDGIKQDSSDAYDSTREAIHEVTQ